MGLRKEKSWIINYSNVTFCGSFLADLGISFSEKKAIMFERHLEK